MFSLWSLVNHRVFKSCCQEESLFPDLCKNWVLIPVIHSESYFCSLIIYWKVCADPSSANTQEGPSTDLWSSFCMQLSALWCTVLWILGTLFCLHPQFCLLNAQRSLFLTGFCCLKWSLETFWDNSSVHVHCFPSLRDQWSWLTYVKKKTKLLFHSRESKFSPS